GRTLRLRARRRQKRYDGTSLKLNRSVRTPVKSVGRLSWRRPRHATDLRNRRSGTGETGSVIGTRRRLRDMLDKLQLPRSGDGPLQASLEVLSPWDDCSRGQFRGLERKGLNGGPHAD